MTDNQTNWQELCDQLSKALGAHSTTWDDDVLLDRVWVALRAAESKHKRKQPTQAEPEPEQLPQGYVDPEHKDQERELLEVFYRACQSEGGTADEIHLRGIKAVLANAPLAKPERKLPTRDEAVALYTAVMVANDCQTLGDMAETFSHAVLAHWGR